MPNEALCHLKDRAEELSSAFNPPFGFWLRGRLDFGDMYCEPCLDIELAAASVSGLWCDDPNEEHFEQPDYDGGYDANHSDAVTTCDRCGRLLAYTLSDYGAKEEVEHFLAHGLSPGPEGAYELACALDTGIALSDDQIATLQRALDASASAEVSR